VRAIKAAFEKFSLSGDGQLANFLFHIRNNSTRASFEKRRVMNTFIFYFARRLLQHKIHNLFSPRENRFGTEYFRKKSHTQNSRRAKSNVHSNVKSEEREKIFTL